ncbi:MAG TPA: 4Fe-4S binding protein [candidate division Zixibacteria bacterium]|nr:4Fe-4S binding protein [candidate division Zixibacteria bacterium]
MPMLKHLTIRTKRLYVQIAAAIITNSFFLAPVLKYVPCPSLNCYACPLAVFACPVGTLQHFIIIGLFPFFLLGFLAVIGLFVGRWACGYLCPFGLLQDLLAKIRRAKLILPEWLSWGRYLSLMVLAVALPALVHEPWFCKLCPAGTLEAGLPIVGQAFVKMKILDQYSQFWGMVGWLFLVKLVLLAGFFVTSIFFRRPFCQTACPLGALFGLFNRVSLLQLSCDRSCEAKADCRKICPVNIDIRKDPSSPDCVRCMQCTACPGVTSTAGGKSDGR